MNPPPAVARLVKIYVRCDCSEEKRRFVYDERSAMRDRFHWARLLAFVTGLVNQELLLRNEYLAAENRILKAHLASRLRLSDAEAPLWLRSRNDSAAKP